MAEFKLGRIRFIWKGAWASSTAYLKDDIIRNGGKTYVCVVGHTSSADFTTDLSNVPTRWNQVSDGTAWMSDWAINTYYRLNDVVKYGGKLYICTTTHTSAATTALGLDANAANWDVYATGFKWQSTWTTSTKYRVNEVVKYGGIIYVCNTNHVSAATATLGLETNIGYWDVYHKGFDYLGQWSGSSVRYKANDLVNFGADVWICITYHTSSASFVEANWSRFIEGLTYENTWSSATTYQPGDIVGYGGYSYISKTINSNATPSTSTTHWGLFTTGFNLIGDWASAQSYQVGNVIRLGGYTYVAILDHTSSGSNTPPNATYWSRLNSGIKWANVNKSYTAVAGTNVSGTGSSATFNVSTSGTSYTVTVNATGTGYAATNTIKILGTAVGGLSPFNDILITVATISGSAIATITSTGYAATWATATGYVAGDSITVGANSYICILAHTSATINRPDNDASGTYWNVLSAGSSTSVLTTTGDIPYMSQSGPARLGIGVAGQVLKVSSALVPSWGYVGVIDQVYYVSPAGTNNPAPDYGVTLDRPWLTVRYATEQVERGSLIPNGSYLLARNRSYIQQEVTGWIDAQVTGSIAPYVSFTYPTSKASYQSYIGYAVDALVYDLSHGGNARSVAFAQTYYANSSRTQDVATFNRMVTVINAVIANTAPGTTYSAINRISDSTRTLESTATTLVTNLVKIITDALTAGVNTNIPSVVNTNYTIFVKTGIYYETLPIIIPANTAIVGDELRSSNIRPRSTSIPTTDTTYSLAAVTRLSAIIATVLTNSAVTVSSGNTATQVTTRPSSSISASTLTTLFTNYKDYINFYINSSGSAPTLTGTVAPTTAQANYDAVEILEANKEFLAQEAVAYTNVTYSTSVSATAANGNITVTSSTNFAVGMPVVFSGTVGASGIVVGTVYYVKTSAANVLTVAATSGGTTLTWTAASGLTATVKLSYDSTMCARDVRELVNAIKYDLVYVGNYRTLLAARYYRRSVQTSVLEDMFYVRNATGLRNVTVQGLTGTLGTANGYGTRRPTAGAYVSLDPGWGAADTRTWISSRSPYIQNVTTFGTGCTGLKIDGTLHNGGNRSIVANDFTQIISDGIGAWCTGTKALTELVSVFSYYAHISYLAENGGKIRATNGNSSYGTYGTVAEGVDSSETTLTATVNNRARGANISNVVTNAVDKIYRVEYLNAGTGYNTATYSFVGTGYGVATVANEFRDNAVYETRLLTNGANYVTTSNTGQAGNTTQVTIAATDSAISSAYTGMRIQLNGGAGAGQSGYIVSYNSGSKIALVAKESFPAMTATATTASSDLITVASTSTLTANMPIYFGAALANISANTLYYVKTISSTTQFSISTIAAGSVFDITSDTSSQTVAVHAAGWDHAVLGTPIVSALDVTTTYTIEPRIVFSSPTYSTAGNTISSNSWIDIAYGDTIATYTAVSASGGSGASATFTVVRTGVAYSVTLASGGTGYAIGNFLQIAGTSLGGSLGNVLGITVTNVVSGTGVITNFTYSGFGAGGNFVAITSAASTTTLISTNGSSWSAGGAILSSNWVAIAYGVVSGNGYWVTVQNGSNVTAYSTNGGVSWTQGGTLSSNSNWASIAYGNGKFIAVVKGSPSTVANITSNGGVNWSTTGALPSDTGWTSIAYGAGTWVVVSSGGNAAAYSTNDGTSWTATTTPSVVSWQSVTYGNGKFVAVANGTAAAYSLDGITWYSVTLPVSSNWSKVRYGQGVFAIVSSSSTNTLLSSEDGLFWTTRTLPVTAACYAIAFGSSTAGSSITPYWAILPQSNTSNMYLILGATARGRVKVTNGAISEFRIVEPGGSYLSAPTFTITDPNATTAFTYTVRTGTGVLANPTFTNRGTQYASSTATVTGNGYTDMYQVGSYVNVSGLISQPIPGSNIVFTGNSTVYKVVAVTNYLSSGAGIAPYNATIQVSPVMSAALAPAHAVTATMRINYSQVRLTGHDFLNIGTGNIANTNYPGTPNLAVDSTKQTVQFGGGRVFFTSTDQDGNFNVGNLFSVQQSTGVATLNADAFNIAGLNQLTIGSVTLGGTSATITSFSTDPYFTSNSDSLVPTQKAIKSYINSQIGGGGSSLNVNTLTAGVVFVSGDTISTTTGVQINVTSKFYFIGGVEGSPLSLSYFLV
jgi:hypothetical protein